MTRTEFFDALNPLGRFMSQVGIPAGVLLVILLMIWRASATLHDTVLVPVVKSHTEFLAATQSTQERQAATLEVMSSAREQQTESLREISDGQREILNRIPPRNASGAVPR